ALAVTVDVSEPADVTRLAEAALERFGGIDVWVNNVGVGALGLFWDIPIEDHARIIDVNLKGPSKAAVLSLSRSLNEELRLSRHENIKVGTIMPWAVDTPWWTHAANYSGHAPRMAAMDDPQIVIGATVAACQEPKEEQAVGWNAHA